MRYLRELLERLPADTPRWRILARELRMFFFQIGQLAVELIVLAVSNGGRCFFIIATIVLGDVPPQRFDPRTRFRFGHALIIRMRIRETMVLSLCVRHPELRRWKGIPTTVREDANVLCMIYPASLDFARDDRKLMRGA